MRLCRIRQFLLIVLSISLLSAAARADNNSLMENEELKFLNDRSKEIVGANLLNAPGFITPAGLTGKNQVVAVADSGVDKGSIDDIHPDLASEPGKKPRIIMLKSWAGRQLADDPVGHGTHMVGTIAGSGKESEGKYKGLAPDASVYFQGILDQQGKVVPPRDINELFLPAYQAGARIHVNAWGSGLNSYSTNAARIDSFMRRYPDFLAIFGSGNSGPGKKSLTSEANSKNALVVGSSVSPRPAIDFSPDGTLDTPAFSSRGPAGDGRIKPDLLAPGTSIISTRSSQVKGNMPGFPMYSRMQGTSMAAAVAAGSAALLREYMQREMGNPYPMAASIKAALINGSRTGEAGPSVEGFGVLDLAGTVLALKEKTMLIDEEKAGILGGKVKTYKYSVEDPGAPFKATLAWTDPAGDTGKKNTLVNNLDLVVTGPDGRKHYGNGFMARSPDTLNNVEQVYIGKPLPGEYTVEVYAVSINAAAGIYSTAVVQDYSLVYGQPLVTGIIKDIRAQNQLTLHNGPGLSLAGREVHYILNGNTSGNLKPEPGFRVYYSKTAAYIAGLQWNPESAQFRESVGGRIWFETDGESREGGYYQNPGTGRGISVNGSFREDISDLPAGVKVSAKVDGVTQTLWQVVTGYRTIKGNVSGTEKNDRGEITGIYLFNDSREFKISPGVSYIYSDTFEGTDPLEGVFGVGNLNGNHKIMPGQQVTLVVHPSSGMVSSVLVNRSIVSGYVTKVNPEDNEIIIENNSALQLFAGADIKKDRSGASLRKVFQGDYVVAVLLPGTRQILGLSAFSKVVYGQVLHTSTRDNTVYMNDFRNHFRMYNLTPESDVRRWGLKAEVSTLSAGTWVRAALAPDGNEIWHMDVAELLEDENKILDSSGNGLIITSDGERYNISDTIISVTKEGLPVALNDLKPGERITLSCLLAPGGKIPVSVKARVPEKIVKPIFMAAVLEESGRLVLSGYTSGDRLYVWHENGLREDIPVEKGPGSFAWQLKFLEGENIIKVVTVNSESGAVSGKTFNRSEITRKQFTDISGHWAEKMILSTAAGGIMAGYGDGTFRPDRPVTMGELSLIWAGVSGSGEISNTSANQTDNITRVAFVEILKNMVSDQENQYKAGRLPFSDLNGLSGKQKEAVNWGYKKGIIKGKSRNVYDPWGLLTRAEAAVMIQKTLQSFMTNK